MVLEGRETNQGIRFIVGICIIALSIYGFYLGLARTNSPELFLVPVHVRTGESPCTGTAFTGISLCAPPGIECVYGPDGTVGIRSSANRYRGEIKLLDRLPNEDRWRESLRSPLIRTFLGDERSMGTAELMERILSRRYNPSLMGVKARLIPSWMKRVENAGIFVPSGDDALLFYTPGQCMGFKFSDRAIALLTCEGDVEKGPMLDLLHSIRITSPE